MFYIVYGILIFTTLLFSRLYFSEKELREDVEESRADWREAYYVQRRIVNDDITTIQGLEAVIENYENAIAELSKKVKKQKK